jgi:hypothetical protein
MVPDSWELSVVREMRLAAVSPVPMMMDWPMVMPGIGMMIIMGRMNDNRRANVMPMVILTGFGIGCGQSDNAQRDKRCCQNFHFLSP